MFQSEKRRIEPDLPVSGLQDLQAGKGQRKRVGGGTSPGVAMVEGIILLRFMEAFGKSLGAFLYRCLPLLQKLQRIFFPQSAAIDCLQQEMAEPGLYMTEIIVADDPLQ